MSLPSACSYYITAFASWHPQFPNMAVCFRLQRLPEQLLSWIMSMSFQGLIILWKLCITRKLNSLCFPCFFCTHHSTLFSLFVVLSHVGWIHVWMADKPAGSIEQSDHICLFALRQCGTLAMTTGAGLDIYLVCWLMSPKRLKAQGGIFRHLPLSSEYSVSLMHVCVLYKHCGLTQLGRSVEGGFSPFGLNLEVFTFLSPW